MSDIAERRNLPATVPEITVAWLDEALAELPVFVGTTITDIKEIGYGLAGSVARIELGAHNNIPSEIALKLARRRSGSAELVFYRCAGS